MLSDESVFNDRERWNSDKWRLIKIDVMMDLYGILVDVNAISHVILVNT